MISERRILASQINGKKSRGPQSWAGKMTARQNAFRHGLSTIHHYNPVFANEIAVMVKAICAGVDYPPLVEQAMVIAECVVLLQHVRAEQVAAIEWFRDPAAVSLRRPGATLVQARARLKQFDAVQNELAILDARAEAQSAPDPGAKPRARGNAVKLPYPAAPPVWRPPTERELDQAMCAAIPELKRLERYERRAWSRRNHALRRFIEIRSHVARPSVTEEGQSGSPTAV